LPLTTVKKYVLSGTNERLYFAMKEY